jgi:malate synthase
LTLPPRLPEEQAAVLSSGALAFLAALHRRFEPERQAVLEQRLIRAKSGAALDFLAETRAIREGEWHVAPLPSELQDRRIEVIGPPDAKTMVAALNSGATAYVADFEDATAPTFENMIRGQINLQKRWSRSIDFTDADTGKKYRLAPKPAPLMVRPRGWHLAEDSVKVEGAALSATIFDFGLSLFHTAAVAQANGSGPYVCLPKLECHREAELWNRLFIFAQSWLGLPLGTIRATVIIETLPAAFRMDEIIYALRDHCAGLRLDSPDYHAAGLRLAGHRTTVPADLLIRTCHRRGCLALADVVPRVPVRRRAEPTAAAQVLAAQAAEQAARAGFDGLAVAHADLVEPARRAFDALVPTANQIYVSRDDVVASAATLLTPIDVPMTEAGLRSLVHVALRYLEARLGGQGCLVVEGHIITAAHGEAARLEIWHALHQRRALAEGQKVTPVYFTAVLADVMKALREEVGVAAYAQGRFKDAQQLLKALSTAPRCRPFGQARLRPESAEPQAASGLITPLRRMRLP